MQSFMSLDWQLESSFSQFIFITMSRMDGIPLGQTSVFIKFHTLPLISHTTQFHHVHPRFLCLIHSCGPPPGSHRETTRGGSYLKMLYMCMW